MLDPEELDANDPLRHTRDLFRLPLNTVYLDGNSLGPVPHASIESANQALVEEWGNDLITSWNKHHWIHLPTQIGDKIGRLIGANTGQIVCCDTISVNLFKVISAALKLNPERKVIATTKDNFPTDIYMAEGVISMLGKDYRIEFLDEDNLQAQLHDDIALLMLTQVNFRSGKKLDMAALTQSAQALGILTLWDLAHSAGAFEVELDKCNADFAVGCTYKYLNGGPGAPAFVYVAERHQHAYKQPLSGWMGHATPFNFTNTYSPHESIKQNLCGTPSVIAMQVLNGALSVFDNVDLIDIERKSYTLQTVFLESMKANGLLSHFTLISPSADQRGSQLAFSHPQAYAICQAWIDQGVIADFRAPDVLRVGFAPLYLSHVEIESAVSRLAKITRNKDYESSNYHKQQAVT